MMHKFDKPDNCGMLKKKGGTFKAWRDRWFTLRGKFMYYFKKKTDKRPAGSIDLTGATVERDKDKKNLFYIDGPLCSRKYELLAEDEASVERWVSKLLQAVASVTDEENQKAIEQAPKVKKDQDAHLIFSQETDQHAPDVGLQDFDLLTVVGRGSFGKVMKVRHKASGEIYAMKVLRKDMIVKENMVAHTKSEKAILQSIHHPFIVGLRFAFQSTTKLYLILDFLSGGELFFHLKQETKFSEERSRFYAAEIALAIQHLHNNDIVYRDLKPENVVLDKYGHVCLTDFGLAKTSMSDQTPTFTFCGTPEYLAPEILKGQGHGKAVDWWSLGVLLYEMLVGLPPFYSENINDMYELILKAPLKFPSFVSPHAQSLLRGLLERDEHKRLGSSAEDFMEIKTHPFFEPLDWEKLYNREITPQFIPEIADDDTKYFDLEFTEEQARDSFAEKVADEEDDFGGFSYATDSPTPKRS